MTHETPAGNPAEEIPPADLQLAQQRDAYPDEIPANPTEGVTGEQLPDLHIQPGVLAEVHATLAATGRAPLGVGGAATAAAKARLEKNRLLDVRSGSYPGFSKPRTEESSDQASRQE